MRSFATLSLLAFGLASAQQKPTCQADNCYRNLIDPRFAAEAVAFCPRFLSATTTAAAAIPTNFNNCAGNVKAVSSACSCVVASTTTKASSTSKAVTTPKPSMVSMITKPHVITSTKASNSTMPGHDDSDSECDSDDSDCSDSDSECDSDDSDCSDSDSDDDCDDSDSDSDCDSDDDECSDSDSDSDDEFDGPHHKNSTMTRSSATRTATRSSTTRIVTATSVRTLTSCPPTLTACPSSYSVVTTQTVVRTTVCPVTTGTPASRVKMPLMGTGTVTSRSTPKPTSSSPVTAGAGRVAGGLQGLAVLAGLVAAGLY